MVDENLSYFLLHEKCRVSGTSKRVSIFCWFHSTIPFHSIPLHSCICNKGRKSSSGRGYSHQCLICIQDGVLLRTKCISLEVTTSSTFNCFLEVTENRNAGRLCNSRKPPLLPFEHIPRDPRSEMELEGL